VAIGRRAVAASRALKGTTVQTLEGLPEDASLWPLAELGEKLMEDFLAGRCDEVVVYYTKFVSAMTQTVTREVLLPFTAAPAQQREVVETDGMVRVPTVEYDPAP